MKKITKRMLAVILAVVMAAIVPLTQATQAEASDGTTGKARYISEVRIGMGETEDEAKKELEADGYTILKDSSGNLADLNVDAGSKSALKRGANDKIVYLGYKTTDNASEAVTDLAVMNMKGGYSIEDYNILMQQQMDSQIKPFVDSFVATLEEYRANYKKSKKSINYIRANYMRKMMNRMTDDDTGKPMGDLLLNKTKYELGDEAYDKLPEEEKKNHCDILTLLMQANGQATLALKKLVSRAADTSKNTWLDRFRGITLNDLMDEVQAEDKSLSSKGDVLAALDRKYGDGADLLLAKWDEFHDQIVDYEDKLDDLEDSLEDTINALEEINDQDLDELTDEDFENRTDVQVEATSQAYDSQIVGVAAYLEEAEYDGNSMLEFFARDYDEVSTTQGLRSLYPMVASLSAGQNAGLEFLSIMELFANALSDEKTYKQAESQLSEVDPASVYEGVNREIYEKGGVALTSDALRAKALQNDSGDSDYEIGTLPIVFWGVTAGLAAATIVSTAVTAGLNKAAANAAQVAEQAYIASQDACKSVVSQTVWANFQKDAYLDAIAKGSDGAVVKGFEDSFDKAVDSLKELETKATELGNNSTVTKTAAEAAEASSQVAKYLSIGLAVLTVIMTTISTVMTILDASKFYDTEYTPIPKYMVDEADITTYNAKGEKVMLKNETAYYRVVECNRTEGDSDITRKNYETMGTRNDLNGDIGKQWLALYAVKYKSGTPILADSLLYQKESSTVPEGYSTGIHEFGGKAATNLNNKKYLFPDNPPSVKIFFKTETKTVEQLTGTASIFGKGSRGTLALGGGVGLILGALLGGLFMGRRKKDSMQSA